jgi:hypothetical protein
MKVKLSRMAQRGIRAMTGKMTFSKATVNSIGEVAVAQL